MAAPPAVRLWPGPGRELRGHGAAGPGAPGFSLFGRRQEAAAARAWRGGAVAPAPLGPGAAARVSGSSERELLGAASEAAGLGRATASPGPDPGLGEEAAPLRTQALAAGFEGVWRPALGCPCPCHVGKDSCPALPVPSGQGHVSLNFQLQLWALPGHAPLDKPYLGGEGRAGQGLGGHAGRPRCVTCLLWQEGVAHAQAQAVLH